MRPEAKHGSSSTRVYFCFVGDQTKPSTRSSLGQHSKSRKNSNVYSPKAFETLIQENPAVIVFFIVCTIYFLLVLSKHLI